MKSIKFEKTLFLFIASLVVCFAACEYDGPEAVWQPDEQGTAKPVISSIEPADSAVAGDFTITLVGENFSDVLSENIVTVSVVKNFYAVANGTGGTIYDVTQANIKEASPTSLLISRPAIIGDSLLIKCAVRNAYQIETYPSPYKLTAVSKEYTRLATGESINAMAMDNQGNMYIYLANKIIDIVSTDGERTQYSDAGIAAVVDMKMGPGGNLYVTRNRNSGLYNIAPDGTSEKIDDFPDKISYFDFDENGNIIAAGRESNLIIRNPDGLYKTVGDYEEFEVTCLRYFNGYVYVFANYRGDLTDVPVVAIWRSKIISASGDIPLDAEAKELVLDWSQAGDDFSDSQIKDMAFSSIESGGDLFITTDNGTVDGDTSIDPILMIHQDGSMEPLYKGGMLDPGSDKVIWDSAQAMYYYNSVNGNVMKLGMKRDGAPYYGRSL